MESDSCKNHNLSGHIFTARSPMDLAAATRPESPDDVSTQVLVASEAPATNHPTFRYCAHVTAAGRHCRMLAGVDSDVCPHHARPSVKRSRNEQDAEKATAELLDPLPNFETPASVHHFIGKVVRQFALKRIPRRDALAYGYLCQLLLTSFADHRKRARRGR